MSNHKSNDFVVQVSNLAYDFLAREQKVYDELIASMSIIQVKYTALLATNTALVADNGALKEKISELEEDISSFKRVSQIIAYEKENARLKKQIEQLIKEQKRERERFNDLDQELELALVEITIDNIEYYVTDDKTKIVYEKLSNGDVGEELGTIVKKKMVFKTE